MSRFLRRFMVFSAAAATLSIPAMAQDVISAKSGLVHLVEGDVKIDGNPVGDHNGTFTSVPKDGVLSTELGRVELLLTPGVFLRVGENSSVRMLNTSLSDTRVEFIGGQAMVESDTPMKDNIVTLIYKDYTVTFKKHGIYGFTSEPAQVRVYSGEADVAAGGQTVTVKEGRLLPFSAAMASEKFDNKNGDALYRWSKRRSEYLSIANLSAAKQARGMNNSFGSSNWFYNSYYGLYTFVPLRGTLYSPFGYAFYSPYTIYDYYYSQPVFYGGGSSGYRPSVYSMPSASRSAAISRGPVSAPSISAGSGGASRGAVAGPAPSTGVARGGSQAGGRGR